MRCLIRNASALKLGKDGLADRMKYRDLLQKIEADGWHVERTVGSHIQYRHRDKPGTITIPGAGKLAKDVPPGTLNSILKQAVL